MSSITRTLRRKPGRSCQSPVMESLERRELLTAEVTVAVTGGKLLITGGNGSENITVTQTGANAFHVAGTGTNINGTADPTGVTGDVVIKLGEGNDIVQLNLLTLTAPKNVSIDGGAGQNLITVVNGIIRGTLTIASSTASMANTDTIITNVQDMVVTGLTTISHGLANPTAGARGFTNEADIADSYLASVKIFNSNSLINTVKVTSSTLASLTLTNLDGHSTTTLDTVQVGGAVTIKEGNTTVEHDIDIKDNSTIGGKLSVEATGKTSVILETFVAVGGDFSVKANSGYRSVQLNVAAVSGSATFTSTGNAGSATSITNGYISKAVTCNNGPGADTFTSTHGHFASVKLLNGDGGSATTFDTASECSGSVTVTNSGSVGSNAYSLSALYVGGNLTLAGGRSGGATITGCTIGGKMSLTTGDDAQQVVLKSVVVAKQLSVSTGGGNDALYFDDMRVGGQTTIDAGVGNFDNVNVERDTSSAIESIFNGPVTFKFGGGGQMQLGRAGGTPDVRAIFGSSLSLIGSSSVSVFHDNWRCLGTLKMSGGISLW